MMKFLIASIILSSAFDFCSNKVTSNMQKKSVIDLINAEHQRKTGIIKGSSFQTYDNRVYDIREKAVQLFGIETDTIKVKRLIVMDMVSFEGGKSIYGEILLNDSAKYFYKSPFLSKEVEKYNYPIDSEETIVEYLKAHRFKELEELANEKGKSLSGSNFIYIGMYEKGMDSIYVKVLPTFISN